MRSLVLIILRCTRFHRCVINIKVQRYMLHVLSGTAMKMNAALWEK